MCLTGGGMVAHQERRHAQQEELRQVGQMAMAGSDGSKMTRWSAAAATPRSGRRGAAAGGTDSGGAVAVRGRSGPWTARSLTRTR